MRSSKCGKGTLLRPTSNRVREALFNILRGRINDTVFLDLYAGTGAVGFNALREGAAEVFFVDAAKRNVAEITAVIAAKWLTERAKAVSKKAVPFIKWASEEGLSFDIIFLDPPYHADEIIYAVSAIGNSDILKKDGIVAAEHFSKMKLPESFGILEKSGEYRYGDTTLTFYKMR